MHKILFINKARHTYWNDAAHTINSKSSGLYNSVRFVVAMLNKNGVSAVMEEAIDNNCIDRIVSIHQPTHVIIEALWVTPEKFEVLKSLHPSIVWIVRLHSEVPFLANEGIAFEWITKYVRMGVIVSANSKRLYDNLKNLYGIDKTKYLPNYYDVDMYNTMLLTKIEKHPNELHIGCFGAIRPLKNQLIQAIAAIEYAAKYKKDLVFHINGGRIEDNASAILKNIRNLFNRSNAVLVEHKWLPHDDFVELLYSMDLLMQDSFSETYNIVAADAVAIGVPVVSSDEITFINRWSRADTTDTVDIIRKIRDTLTYKCLYTRWNKILLKRDARNAKHTWLCNFK